MRILITGANGHLGANICRSLLKRGFEVVPFVRPTSDLRGLVPLNLDYVYGDVLEESSLLAAAKGCDVVIHTAAVYRLWAREPDEIMQPALKGTRNLFKAAKVAGIKRIIYTSTMWAVGLSKSPDRLLTAADWNIHSKNPYAVAKTRAEQMAWEMADEAGIPMIAICPNGVIGPYDYRITPSTASFRDWINGTQVTPRSGIAYVDVFDVGEIHALAVSEGEAGKRYIVSGENLTLREFGQLLGEMTGFAPIHVGFGRKTLALTGKLFEGVSKLSNTKPFFTSALAHDIVDRYMFTDCEETWDTFNYQPRPTRDMVADTIRWLLFMDEIESGRAALFAQEFPPRPEWTAA